MNKQQKIRQACILNDNSVFGRPLHSGDILRVIRNSRKKVNIRYDLINPDLLWFERHNNISDTTYNLSLPFTEQKEEVYNFIINILDK